MTKELVKCRVCAAKLTEPAFDDPGPSLTSIRTVLNVPTRVYLCDTCGHAQSSDLPDVDEFYDTQYRISLDIDGHDQLYENSRGEQVFRTAYQAEIVQGLDIPQGARVLDFGAGKATTLQRVVEARPDISPHVFDVSKDYVAHWDTWVPDENQATYEPPQDWTGRFDLITAHFVLEHVADPVPILRDLQRCLASEGRLFLTVPDAESNTGDLLVVDHLNHFSHSSMIQTLQSAGLMARHIDRDIFAGSFAVIASAGASTQPVQADTQTARDVLEMWKGILHRLDTQDMQKPVAIYGAGFYGSVVAARLSSGCACFLDRNPYLQGQEHMNIPVLAPEDRPDDIATFVVALNPARAREIVGPDADWLPNDAQLIYLDA